MSIDFDKPITFGGVRDLEKFRSRLPNWER